ncbi:acyl-CoA dehydrogenase NM domain-like protein [Gymnopus androsaceus JB14]|uniref:Acyl-CoA dehydrogenase NM domain-like protein n=1 Tax=Gymnopus androsaceus JB14 TaxID=1447944 RepID=A0A6A4HWG4_9AGAR|nr:acyl-CoA dehydrogenase NM domain-like protein [Gymnopus androsaceus JB14]
MRTLDLRCQQRLNFAPPTATRRFTHYNASLAGLSPSEAEFRETVWDFAERVVGPVADEIDLTGGKNTETLLDVHRKTGEMGLLGITVPTEENTSSLGLSLGYFHHLLAMEAMSYYSGNLCVNQISRWGTDTQKAEFLPKLMSGEFMGALAMSEPGAGSDVLGSMKTTATYVPEEHGYRLNGSKFWITNGPVADVVVVYAKDAIKASESAGPNIHTTKQTYTAFLVPRNTPGFSAGTPLDKFGMKGSPTCELFFDNAFIPEANVLGGPETMKGKGSKVLMSGLDLERLVLSGGPLGIMQAAYDTAVEYVHQREQFGVKVASFGIMQAKLADMYTALNSARTFAYAVARAVDEHAATVKGSDNSNAKNDHGYPTQRRDCAAAIMYTTEKSIEVAQECMQCLGGNGYTNDYPAARYLRDARLYAVGAGTQEVRRWLIGREVNADFE